MRNINIINKENSSDVYGNATTALCYSTLVLFSKQLNNQSYNRTPSLITLQQNFFLKLIKQAITIYVNMSFKEASYFL